MFKPHAWLVLLGVAGSYATTTPAVRPDASRFCSLSPPPPDTGFDPTRLVRFAQVVVLARADSQSRTGQLPGGRTYSVVHFTVTETIDSGKMHIPVSLRVPGDVTTQPDFNPAAVPYHWVRPSGLRGSCYASGYQQGGEFLLLLRGPSADSLDPYWAALSPTNEQVHGRDDPWVAWVRRVRHP